MVSNSEQSTASPGLLASSDSAQGTSIWENLTASKPCIWLSKSALVSKCTHKMYLSTIQTLGEFANFEHPMPSSYSEIVKSLTTESTAKESMRTGLIFYNGVVVKRAPLDEPLNMLFVRHHTKVPVPGVLGIGPDYFIMDEIQGKQLVWDDTCDKDKVLAQLRDYLAQIHALKATKVGNHDGLCRICRRHDFEGKCETLQDFHKLCVSTISPLFPQPFKEHLEISLGSSYDINFCHGDLALQNILVDSESNIAAIIDWEYSGFYPEYWDSVRVLRTNIWKTDWPNRMREVMRPYDALSYVHRILDMFS
ncbi:hypothetical protein IWQ62_001361 [Dispira parvispora]|uniref:Aminoglycoside phosphotransferase domain-containing protein n=1 Tax=Dispira parvispora TaxID=1520584 RepID=A0A9W8ASK9_9FUNG|nr:hypothetical protein IWQ62_001361 [Dispira parvispora]